METQIFDDGSTLTFDPGSNSIYSTDATDVYNQASASYGPGAVSSGAGSWEDVLRFGLTRAIDAKVRPVRPENTVPLLSRSPYYVGTAGAGGLSGMLPWLIIGGVVLLVVSKYAKG